MLLLLLLEVVVTTLLLLLFIVMMVMKRVAVVTLFLMFNWCCYCRWLCSRRRCYMTKYLSNVSICCS